MVAMQNYANPSQLGFNPQSQYAPQGPSQYVSQGIPQYAPPMPSPTRISANSKTTGSSGVQINIEKPVGEELEQESKVSSPYEMPESSIYGVPQKSLWGAPPPLYQQTAASLPMSPSYPPMTPPQYQSIQQAQSALNQTAPAKTNTPQTADSDESKAQPVVNKIVPPPSAIDQQEATAPTNTNQQSEGADSVKKPEAEPEQSQVNQGSQQTKPEQSKINIQGINDSLNSQNAQQQREAIEKIAEIGQSNTPESDELLNENTIKSLTGIVSKDNSKLQGTAKNDAQNNKKIAMWDLAILQNNARDQLNAEAQKQGIPPMTIKDLPGITETVKNVKTDPDPVIRKAGISALNYLARPEDKDILTPIYSDALKDKGTVKDKDGKDEPIVKNAATSALAKFQPSTQNKQNGN